MKGGITLALHELLFLLLLKLLLQKTRQKQCKDSFQIPLLCEI